MTRLAIVGSTGARFGAVVDAGAAVSAAMAPGIAHAGTPNIPLNPIGVAGSGGRSYSSTLDGFDSAALPEGGLIDPAVVAEPGSDPGASGARTATGSGLSCDEDPRECVASMAAMCSAANGASARGALRSGAAAFASGSGDVSISTSSSPTELARLLDSKSSDTGGRSCAPPMMAT